MSDYDNAFNQSFSGSKKSSSSDYDEAAKKSLDITTTTPPATEAPAAVDYSGSLRFATPFGNLDTGITLPQSVNKGLAQFGSGIADLGVAFSSPETVDEKRKFDKPLLDSAMGKVLNFAGKAAPAMAIPGSGVLGGMAAGGSIGLIEPVGTGESRTSNAVTSAALGGVIPGIVKGAQWLARPNDATGKLAQSALDQGIPIGVSDMTQNKFTKGLRSVLDDLPFIGGIGGRANNAKQEGFDTAVAKVIGSNERLAPAAMSSAKNRIVGELNKAWDNPMSYNANLFDTFRKSETLAADLPKADAARLTGWIKDIESKIVQNPDQTLSIPGQVANRFQSNLRQLAENTQGMSGGDLRALRQLFIGEFNDQIGGAAGDALTKARQQYRAFKSLEPILNKAESGVAGRLPGEVSPALLSGQIAKDYGSASRSPFGDLPQIGSQFLVDRTLRTGGSPRAMVQNSMIGGALAGSAGLGGALLGGSIGGVAGAGASAGMGAIIEKLLSSPSVTQSVLSPAMKRGLLDNPELTPALVELLKKSSSRLPVSAGMGLLSAPAFE